MSGQHVDEEAIRSFLRRPADQLLFSWVTREGVTVNFLKQRCGAVRATPQRLLDEGAITRELVNGRRGFAYFLYRRK